MITKNGSKTKVSSPSIDIPTVDPASGENRSPKATSVARGIQLPACHEDDAKSSNTKLQHLEAQVQKMSNEIDRQKSETLRLLGLEKEVNRSLEAKMQKLAEETAMLKRRVLEFESQKVAHP